MTTFIHISDSHIGLPDANQHWETALKIIKARQPDFVLHTGDVTEYGHQADFEQARADLDGLGIPWRAIPGNHDIGDGPPAGKGPNPDALKRYDIALGPSRFAYPLGAWTLIGMSGLEFGTGGSAESAAKAWLIQAMASVSGPIILAFHKPIFVDHIAEVTESSAAMPAYARAHLAVRLRQPNIKLVLSGHRHAHRVIQNDLVCTVWAPAVNGPPETTPPMAGTSALPAMLEFRLSPHGHQHQIVPLHEAKT